MLLAAMIVQYLRQRKLTIGLLLSTAGLFCAALTRFPTMQNEIFFWSTIGLFAVSVAVSLGELAMAFYARRPKSGAEHTPPQSAAAS